MKSGALKCLNIFMVIGIALTIITMALTPAVLTASMKQYHEFMAQNPYAVWELTAGFYLCVIPILLALFGLKKICKSFNRGEFFAEHISRGFKRIAIYAFVDGALIFLVQFAPTLLFGSFMYALTVIPAFVLPFVAVTIGLLFMVLSIVFSEATAIKSENDAIF